MSPAWSLQFHLVCTWIMSDSLVPPRAFVQHSPMELSITPLLGIASPISVPCRQSDLDVQYHPWSKVDIRGQLHHLIQWGMSGGRGHSRANPGFGVFWFILPTWLSYLQQTCYIGRISPVCIHEVGVTLVQFRVVSSTADS